ncbi:hypothetical protein KR767_11480 [Luteibacter anthropi]|uniref:Uncharacterized protein n=1 Tax=Luteibacter anthropi TaxID=564369 RepID=A0A7X5ZI61_9GAMM|nr:hypothetical protein [Luteibacter anthropi]NII06517.1 hypothetical protein [Luteibacter anthropi]URX60729.1 hypothetical protein KR767_11480 [Luteibacter anthropi]
MQRKTLIASAVSLLLAGSAAFAFAQDAAPQAPAAPAAHSAPQGQGQGQKWGRGPGGDHGKGGWSQHGHGGMRSGVIGDIRGLERLYIMSGRQKELPALYNDILAKSQNPRVRDYAYRHLARTQMQPQNVDAAIATMRKSLDESLAQDQKRHQEMEAFKARMQQRASAKTPDSK